jgi:hypothetical protein
VLRVITAGRRAFRRFAARRADRFAHLERHDAPEAILLLLQNLRRGNKPACAIGQRRMPVGAPGGIGTRQRGIYLCIR